MSPKVVNALSSPAILLLGPERTYVQPSPMPERRHEYECFDLRAVDLDQTLAEVDLQLSARRRLEPRRRQRLGLQRLTRTARPVAAFAG